MAARGAGVVAPVIPDPTLIGLDYQFNWPGYNYGDAFALSPVGVTGGPDAFYIGIGVGLNPAPVPQGAGRVWTGSAWVPSADAKVWDGSGWVPLAGTKAWSGTDWVVV